MVGSSLAEWDPYEERQGELAASRGAGGWHGRLLHNDGESIAVVVQWWHWGQEPAAHCVHSDHEYVASTHGSRDFSLQFHFERGRGRRQTAMLRGTKLMSFMRSAKLFREASPSEQLPRIFRQTMGSTEVTESHAPPLQIFHGNNPQ
jgi:hypothetical protein